MEIETYAQAMSNARREYLVRLMQFAHDKIYLASLVSGINRTALYRMVREVDPGRRDHRRKA